MNSMVRRVARALAEANSGGDMCDYVEMAHAAIAAMREPTKAMLDATTHPNCVETMDDIKDVWMDMIDAALVTS